jgi:hypothetical protein
MVALKPFEPYLDYWAKGAVLELQKSFDPLNLLGESLLVVQLQIRLNKTFTHV